MTEFIGLAFGVRDGKLCAIAASNGYGIVEREGLTTKECFAFLWSLSCVRQKRVLVCFNSAVDFELIVKDLTRHQKDSIFGILRLLEETAKGTPLYEPPPINGREVTSALGYRLSALPGKIFRLGKPKKAALNVYDIESFFACGDISDAVEVFLGETLPRLKRNDLSLWQSEQESSLLDRCFLEAEYVTRLADRVQEVISPLDLGVKQWYGPSAIAARCLTKWKARRQAKRLHEKNTASELLKAIDCAYIGGRVELLKNGTIQDVGTYDLNSAYAYAVTLLSQFYKPLAFTRRYASNSDAPFSCWLVDYDLPKTSVLGVLPTRAPGGAISFRGRGKGYFWQPEVDYLVQRYPDCFRVIWGYTAPYDPVTFGPDVYRLYDYRMQLKQAGDKGETIIKLALANLYGKFAQNTGKAHFQCRAWAGWITSFIRRLLLDAVTGIEDRVISFNQDAIHVTGENPNVGTAKLDLGQGLGQWKADQFAEGFYLAPGLYDLRRKGESVKQASRGANLGLNWQQIATDLSERQLTELMRSFFVGYRMSRMQPGVYGPKYLEEVQESLEIIPSRLRARDYRSHFDWSQEYRDSDISRQWDGQLSRRYVPQDTSSGALRLKLKDRGWETQQ